MWAPCHFRLGWVGVGVLLGGITVGGAGGADGTGEDGGSGGGAGGAQVRGERDPGIAFFTFQGQICPPAMAPNTAEFVDKII